MSNHMLLPMVQIGGPEEVDVRAGGAQEQQFLPPMQNYASDEKLSNFLVHELGALIQQVRTERGMLEQEWLAIRNMNLMVHDSGRSYFGRSNAYMPVYRRNRQTLITTAGRGLFPSDEYLDVTLKGEGDHERARPVKAYMQWEFDTVAKVRSYLTPFLANFFDYGTAPLKVWYKKELHRQGRLNNVEAALFGPPIRQYGFKPRVAREGLAVSPRSLFNWFIYPVTAESLDDAVLVFEDVDLPFSYAEAMVRAGKWPKSAVELACSDIVEAERNRLEMVASRGYGSDTSARDVSSHGRRIHVTEAWTWLTLPRSAYLSDEDHRMPVPAMVVFVNSVPVQVVRNPHFHQKPPYVVGRNDWEAGFFYGVGAGRTIRPLQYLSNDFTNQVNDVGNYGLNPIAKINPGLLVGPPKPFRPGGVIYTTDVKNGIEFDRPPIEQVHYGMNMVNTFMSMASDFGGTPPIMQGNPKGAKTATQTSILQKNAQVPIQDVVESIENDVMVPMMHMTWSNAQQWRNENVMATVAGESIKVTLEDLALDAQFRWLASSQAVNNQVRAQQAIQLISAILPVVPLMMQQGYVVDFVALLRRVYTDGFGFRGFSEFIRRAQAAPMQPGMQPGQPGSEPRPDQMGGVQQEQGDRLRSAMEQVHGYGDENSAAQPGEAEDFAEVRNEADQMAAMMGAAGGGM